MCMNGKVNQSPLFDINVRCNRLLKTKLHPMIVWQYSHLSYIQQCKLSYTSMCTKSLLTSKYHYFQNSTSTILLKFPSQKKSLEYYFGACEGLKSTNRKSKNFIKNLSKLALEFHDNIMFTMSTRR